VGTNREFFPGSIDKASIVIRFTDKLSSNLGAWPGTNDLGPSCIKVVKRFFQAKKVEPL